MTAVTITADRLAQQVEAPSASGQSLIQVERTQTDEQNRCIAQGYEQVETITAQLDGLSFTWTERRRLLQSMAAKLSAQQGLFTRLKQAHQALSELTVRRQSKAVFTDQAVADPTAHFWVEG